MRWGIRARRPASASVGLALRTQHLLEPLADEATTADRAGEEVGSAVGIGDLPVVELFQFLRALPARSVADGLVVYMPGGALACGQYLLDLHHPECLRCVADCSLAVRQ